MKLQKSSMMIGLTLLSLSASTNVAFAQTDSAKEMRPAQETVLDLQEYLNEVRSGSQAYQAAKQSSEAGGERSGESKLLTRPNLIANAQYARSKADTGSSFSGDDNTQKTYSLGISEITDFGLSAQLTYGVNQFSSNAALPSNLAASGFVFQTDYATAGPQLALTGNLLRNFFGAEIRAQKEAIEAAALAQKYGQSFAMTQSLAEAETAYWGLALAREQVASSKEVLALTEKSQKWSANRQRLELTDKSDLLQANAALLGRRLALQAALDNERAAARRFNTLRGVDSDAVAENLRSFDPAIIDKLQVPARVQFRDDVKAAEQQKRAAAAQAILGEQKNNPTLNVTAAIGLNGRDPLTGQAVSASLQTTRPNYGIGLQANIPLDFATQSEVRAGYRKDAAAADTLYQRRVFEQERLWHDLTSVFNDAIGRYRISVDVEKANKEKVTYERYRHDRGRSTLYQVILFENDFAESQLSRIRAQADVLNAYAQLRTFGGGQ